MRLATYEHNGSLFYGAIVDQGVVELGSKLQIPSLQALLAANALDRAADAAAEAEAELSLDDVMLKPPIPTPAKIICIGANFLSHVDEAPFPNEQLLTKVPVTFFRAAESFVGHGEQLVRPSVAQSYDYEGELAVVIGEVAWHVERDDAYRFVAGYAAANEGCVREWQMHTLQWTPGKNFWRSGAWGPWIVTSDEVGDITAHTVTTSVNGEQRQHDALANMIHDIPACISYITTWTPLFPGDVLMMGTPAGVGAFKPEYLLQSTDVVEVEVSCVGAPLRNTVVDETEVARPDAVVVAGSAE